MNLLNARWLPVRRASTAARDWVAPDQLSDPDILAFDAPRPDFNGALAQFAIGLLQSTADFESTSEWARLFEQPPSIQTLREWFQPVAAAFEFDGDGARFMQDLTLKLEDGSVNEISALLIDTPGKKTEEDNTDHFVKRGYAQHLCSNCAAAALLTLQVNGPEGGRGYLTGVRGGGPLTTLVVCERSVGGFKSSLWHDLWLNVTDSEEFSAGRGNADLLAPHFRFPWMADITAIQKPDGETTPARVHPLHVFWATPRRIRLDFSQLSAGRCEICGRESEQRLSQYVTKNQGLNYKGDWRHPLSPYYAVKEGWLPVHPRPGGIGYRHWLPWILGMKSAKVEIRRADVVDRAIAKSVRLLTKTARPSLSLWAFGYDLKSAKPRCWYESLLPVYSLEECEPTRVEGLGAEVGNWIAGADLAAEYLRNAVKDAWFGGEARGDYSAVDAGFWSRTESAFYQGLSDYIAAVSIGRLPILTELRQTFYNALKIVALTLFDEDFVGAGVIERQNPRRVAAAHRQLTANLNGPKIRQLFGFEVATGKTKTKRGKKAVA
jgi:CRISPR system Cascade subunit CasA